jgi:hypothetical protein
MGKHAISPQQHWLTKRIQPCIHNTVPNCPRQLIPLRFHRKPSWVSLEERFHHANRLTLSEYLLVSLSSLYVFLSTLQFSR